MLGKREFTESRISVVIMTLNAEVYINELLTALWAQSVLPNEVIVADSESEDKTSYIARQFSNTKVINIERSKYDHGGSRDYALQHTSGDFVFFFTQDVVLNQKNFIECMMSNFDDNKVAMVYGRQLARKTAVSYEKLIREFNYPETRKVKTYASVETMGIKTFYMSDVCSVYRREVYRKLGGFEKHILTNEDMLIAAKAIKNGYTVVYEARSCVEHSHNFTWMEEFRRNFNVGVFLSMYSKFLNCPSEYGEGIRLFKYVFGKLLFSGKILDCLKFIQICSAKMLGNKLGKNYRHLSLAFIRKISKSNYWNYYEEFCEYNK